MNSNKSWLNKISEALMREPQDQEELLEILRDANERKLLDSEALNMMEGVLQISQMRVSDIMIPKAQTIMITEDEKLPEIIQTIISSGHSRFPIINEKHNDVLGILLAKEILPYAVDSSKAFNLLDLLRPTMFIPASKRLDILLKEFKQNKNHMAIVADEHGGIAGLITMEDILEQIVGQIADEFDPEEQNNKITEVSPGKYLVQAQATVDEINQYFDCDLPNNEMDTIGGLVLQAKGYMPTPGEMVEIAGLRVQVVGADGRRLHLLEISRLTK